MQRSRTLGIAVAAVVLAAVGTMAQNDAGPKPQHVRANGAELEYISQGTGTPVVFAHGAVADLRYWEPQRAAFAKQHRFVSVTYRYHGLGTWADEGKLYSAETHAADLVALIKALNLGPVHLVGLSYGGQVATIVATKEPQLVRTLTLAEPALFALLAESPKGQVALEAWTKASAPMLATLKTGDAVGATKQLAAAVIGDAFPGFDNLPSPLRQGLLDNARTLPLLFASAPPSVNCALLRGIKQPTLLVRGERTPSFFAAVNEEAAQCIAGSTSISISKASHAMSFDNPAEFNREVLAFIGKHP